MLSWLVAATGMWRGLTSEEADAVEGEVRERLAVLRLDPLDDLSAGEARDVLDAAIAAVLERTRS